MAERTFYTFTLSDGIHGLRRALADAHVTILEVIVEGRLATFSIEQQGNAGEIVLEEIEVHDHPLARLGRISAVRVTRPDDWPSLETVLTLAFLRGGG